jgi:hypothetical protein
MSTPPIEGVPTAANPRAGIVDPLKAATHPLKADHDADAEDRAKLIAATPKPTTPAPRVAPGSVDLKA